MTTHYPAERRPSLSSRGRPATGQVRIYARRDGLTTFSLRLRANGERHTIRLGTEAEGWSHVRAERELRNVQAEIRAGRWTPPKPKNSVEDPTLHEFVSLWFKRKVADGVADKTRRDL